MSHSLDRLSLVVRRLLSARHDEKGATAVEYALMMAFITAVIVGGVAALGGATVRMFMMAVASFP